VKQARKWLANRRVRTCNTLTYNGAVHPRRLRRLRRQQGQTVEVDRAGPPQPLHSTSTAGVRVPPETGFFHDSAFQTSTPLPGTFRHRGTRFQVNSSADRDYVTGVRHHPYVASTSRCERWMPVAATPVMPRVGYFAETAANLASIRQVATAQLNVFNVYNST